MATTPMPVGVSLEERLSSAVHDTPDILTKLSKKNYAEDDTIEIITELPAGLNCEIIIAMVMRWREIQQHFDRDVRVYAWTFNPVVEKYIQQCTASMSRILVTCLPVHLRGDNKYV